MNIFIKLSLTSGIINLQNSDAWKIQLTIVINFISLKDNEEEYVMHSSSDNRKFTSYSEINYVIEKLFKSLRSKYKDGLEKSIKGKDFIFGSVQLTYYQPHRVYFKHGGSYIDPPDWIKKSNNKSKKMKIINVFNKQQLLH